MLKQELVKGIFLRRGEKTIKLQDVESLQKISEKELIKKRSKKTPGLILKLGDNLYYCPIEKNDLLEINMSKHLCPFCVRCSAADDPKGCKKVRARIRWALMSEGHSFIYSIMNSDRIERFDFIKKGVETINTTREQIVVIECCDYRLPREYQSDKMWYDKLVKDQKRI